MKDSEERKSIQKINESLKTYLGSLIPLECRHNGKLNQKELEILHFHVQQTGVLKYELN